MKLQMIELSIAQQDLQLSQHTLTNDIHALELQLKNTQEKEAQEAEREEFDEAERLN